MDLNISKLNKRNTMPVAGNFIERVNQQFGGATPRVILDVGSRDLQESMQMSRAWPDAKIFAFEPNPDQFKICAEEAKNYPNIQVFEYAAGDVEELVTFYVVDGNAGASSILEPIHMPGGWDNQYQDRTWRAIPGIQVKRLDTVLDSLGVDAVDLVWIDVQGNEFRALTGLGKYINDVKIIHAEAALRPYYKGQVVKDELEGWLNEQGFDTEFLDLNAQQEHPYGESDMLCIRKSL
jgi:FkbM family methyltransferase